MQYCQFHETTIVVSRAKNKVIVMRETKSLRLLDKETLRVRPALDLSLLRPPFLLLGLVFSSHFISYTFKKKRCLSLSG